MIVRIIGLVFLFIIRIRFPVRKSVADIIRNRYGKDYIKKYEGLKNAISNSGNDGVIPKFFRFELVNRHLGNSHVYKKCQIRLLQKKKKKKSNQSERGLTPWKKMHRGLRKDYKEHFLL